MSQHSFNNVLRPIMWRAWVDVALLTEATADALELRKFVPRTGTYPSYNRTSYGN